MSKYICEITSIRQEEIDKVSKAMESYPAAEEMAGFFKAFGDPTRLKIILALYHAELCVCDITALVGISISGLSHQLRYLRNLNIVKFRKEGKLAYYSLTDEHIGTLIDMVSQHLNE